MSCSCSKGRCADRFSFAKRSILEKVGGGSSRIGMTVTGGSSNLQDEFANGTRRSDDGLLKGPPLTSPEMDTSVTENKFHHDFRLVIGIARHS